MIISLVWFLVILGLSCLLVGLAVYVYCLSTYTTKPYHCEVVREESFKIPIETEKETIELDAKILKSIYTPTDAPCVIVCHGWMSDLRALRYLQEPLTLHGYAVVAYSSRGHGKSGGRREFPAIYEDIIKVIDYLQEQNQFGIDTNRIAVVGHSMGASIALNHAYLDERVKVVVGISAMHNVKESFERKKKIFSLPFWAKVWLKLTRLQTKLTDEENHYASPRFYLEQPSNTEVFLIHAKNDPLVEFDNFEKNVALLNLPEDHFLIFDKGGHSFFHQESMILSQVIKWLDKYL
ncbi:MAG: alpha/beta hydrolase [Candidatus Helarchaeota archaeon]